jgi:hypothetical protein
MARENSVSDSPMVNLLRTLATVEPGDAEVISLYLDLRAGDRGRDTHDVFLRRVFGGRAEPDDEGAPGVAAALPRIQQFLATVEPSAQAAAVFTTAGESGLFEALALDAPIDGHQLYIGPVPHLYTLARVIDQDPRYAAVQLDNHQARIVVFGRGAPGVRAEVTGEKTRRHSMGGWSQARYQRRTENVHLHHLKEVAGALERIVRDEGIEHVVIAGDAATTARLREHLAADVDTKIAGVLPLDRHAGEDALLDEAVEALRKKDADTDAERVAEVVGAWRAGGLGVVGPEATLTALRLGQVDEVLMSAVPSALKPVQRMPDDAAPPPSTIDAAADVNLGPAQAHLADELVTRAAQTSASVRMIEDPALLADHGGVAAVLRFRV